MQVTYPMTTFGHAKLTAELNYLKLDERPKVIKAIEEAADLGDLKENAEYHAAKERQGQIDMRLNELQEILGNTQLVDPSKLEHSRISFGSTVVLENLTTETEVTYTIVGACEANPDNGLISFHSPLAKQILGKEEGDEFTAKLPNGKVEFEVIDVTYKDIVFECHEA